MEWEGEPESGGVMPPAHVFHLPDKGPKQMGRRGSFLGEAET